jgi:hypothetical protein
VTSSEAEDQQHIAVDRKYALRPSAVSWLDVDGEIVAFDVGSGSYLSLNGSGRLLWQALVEPTSVEELVQSLRASFAISEEQAEADAVAFVEDLVERQLVEALA